ncbi:MAG: hypothetical protein MUF62_12715 [Chitinophagaceae bacterium]|jgi:hypothetical protein|nr:hypothetical protein [Chitinophagaceae bacterium]
MAFVVEIKRNLSRKKRKALIEKARALADAARKEETSGISLHQFFGADNTVADGLKWQKKNRGEWS